MAQLIDFSSNTFTEDRGYLVLEEKTTWAERVRATTALFVLVQMVGSRGYSLLPFTGYDPLSWSELQIPFPKDGLMRIRIVALAHISELDTTLTHSPTPRFYYNPIATSELKIQEVSWDAEAQSLVYRDVEVLEEILNPLNNVGEKEQHALRSFDYCHALTRLIYKIEFEHCDKAGLTADYYKLDLKLQGIHSDFLYGQHEGGDTPYWYQIALRFETSLPLMHNLNILNP